MLPEYMGQTSFFGTDPPLPLAAGYGIVLGFGAFFSVFTTVLVFLDKKYNNTEQTSEFFNTAGRNVKTGLTASVIVSQWTWAATLLQSSNVAWCFGVSGPFWYASGATIQVLLFGILAIEVKRKARTAHTICEMVRARWGTAAHITFLFFCFLTNIIVTSMLLLGGAATVNALTGMDINLASFLIPWGVILYTFAGGLKATFLASYFHTTIIFVVLVVCIFTVYVKTSSTDLVYDGLEMVKNMDAATCTTLFGADYAGGYSCGPVLDNEQGSYLTMLSLGGLKFGIINVVGNFGTVFVDQSYWQSAIAAKPASAHKGYILGGLVWFTIPFALATSLGIYGVAFQLPITAAEAGSGLVPPAVATHLFGKFGAAMMATMLFMAITSTGSAEGIAVSSLVAYDIYRTYINPQATGKQILMVSRVVILVFGLSMGGLSCILNQIEGINLGWVYNFMGIVIGSAVVPLWYCLTWDKASGPGAVIAAWTGQILAVILWIVVASADQGEVSIATLGTLNCQLAGCITSIVSSGLIHTIISFIAPQNYDWKSMGEIQLLDDDKRGLPEMLPMEFSDEFLTKALNWVKLYGYGFTILIVIAWPILSVPAGVFTKDYWAFWVFISLMWGFIATAVIISLPLLESKDEILNVLFAMAGKQYVSKKSAEDAPAASSS
jgi:SSS family transporter